MTVYRTERDTLGEVEVPADAYWGAQTERSRRNFEIGPPGSMPTELIRAFAVLKAAAARTNAELGVLAPEKAAQIDAVCGEILSGSLDAHFPLVVWQTGSGTQTNMNVNEVIANRAHVLAGGKLGDGEHTLHPNDDVNCSQSSNDTFPTAISIAACQLLRTHTLPQLAALGNALELKSDAFSTIVKIGRTHLMDATPLTLGQEFSGYATLVRNGQAALERTLPHLAELALGGTAVGTGLNAPPGYAKSVAAHIAQQTGLPFISAPNKFETLSAHDAVVEAHGALKQIAISLTKIANDIRWMGSGPRSGLGELRLPANEPGSSIMPGKVNPTQTEALTMVCAQIIGNDAAIAAGAMQGHFELNVFKPMVARNMLESARLLGDAVRSFIAHCLDGLEADAVQIQRHVENSLMLVTALNPHIGYEKAATIAKLAHREGLTLKAAALKTGYVTEAQFDAWVNAADMVR